MAAQITAGPEMDRRRLRPRCTENSTSNFKTERQGRGSPAENEKRLPHLANLGRCDRRTESTETKSRRQRVGIPIANRLILSAIRSRWGQRLGQKVAISENNNLCKTKIPEILRFRGFLARREGFETPAFWSIGCLGEKTEPFQLHFPLFAAVHSADLPLFPPGTTCSGSNLGQKWVKRKMRYIFWE